MRFLRRVWFSSEWVGKETDTHHRIRFGLIQLECSLHNEYKNLGREMETKGKRSCKSIPIACWTNVWLGCDSQTSIPRSGEANSPASSYALNRGGENESKYIVRNPFRFRWRCMNETAYLALAWWFKRRWSNCLRSIQEPWLGGKLRVDLTPNRSEPDSSTLT